MIAVALLLGIRFFKVISDYSVNVLFFDQWDFLGPLFAGHAGLGELFFHQHGPHREGLGLIADRFLYPLTAWNTRADSFLIAGCVFAAMLLALLLKYRLFGGLSYGDVAIPLIFLTLAQFETFIGTPNAAYSGIPLLLTMLYCLALLVRRYQTRYALCLLVNLLLIYTGFGLFMGIVTIGVFAVECYWRLRSVSEIPLPASIAAMLVACASLGSFFVHYTFQSAVACFEFPYHSLRAYPLFVALMVSRFFGLMTPVRAAEAVGALGILLAAAILFGLAWRLVRGRRFENVDLITAVLLAFSILFAVNTAMGRVCLGLPTAAWPPRYATLLIPGVTAFYFWLQRLGSTDIRRTLTGIFIVVLLPGSVSIEPGLAWFATGKQAWVACYLANENISGCDKSAGFVVYPDPERTRLKEKLNYLKAHHLNLYASDSKQYNQSRF